MKKWLVPLSLVFLLLISACSNGNTDKDKNSASSDNKEEMVTYQSESGSVKVPKNPKRVVVLSSFAGNLASLDINIVGVDSWAKDNPRYNKYLKDAEVVSEDDLEKIIELNPDLIVGLSTTKNIDKLKDIAPTVTYTWGKLDYLEQQIEIGKLVGKEDEAQKWVDDFKKRAQQAGKDVKAKIGEDATVSVIESANKELYVFGDNWARGTEVLYQGMGLKMPEKVKQDALKEGYRSISAEVLPQYAGDYIIFSKSSEADNSFQQTETYKNIPAVKNGHLFEMDAKEAYFSDPITLDYQLDFFKKSFLEK
ncbi:iron-hydroxamate ABC transporter substrate-binding protein [Priestia filamentosa]|uniref:iron-hydroxamate ABC transporter substrate-binding protein n=1 Tax=Priestia filamentosa TaxID=1402861 RepID=UPI001FB24D59|nr:iron-hydroxamate ABC transporter substrate-binding protein [Priestia filamentosa]UOE60666.1 iron-hydroxamate ABC transporter substrate-binding protein [Priestia filamentosa]